MNLKSIELSGFKSFAKKDVFSFSSPISAIVGPNGSGKSNVAEAFRFVLGEQSMKSMRSRRGEDLIFNGSPNMPRAGRAQAKVTFDNSSRMFDIDYDEVAVERIVHRDGVNEYLLNGSQVRLRDILELLAGANIGSSGHLIISQGEADRILNASNKERREITLDALGLKVYQYKKQEGEKKLLKTEENIAQVESLRKEILPHLKFLERQMQKIEKALGMKEELKELYKEYLKRESEYLAYEKDCIARDRKEPEEKLKRLEGELQKAKQVLEKSEHHDEKSGELIKLENDLGTLRKEKDILSRDIGRVEGQISFEERRIKQEEERAREGLNTTVPLEDVKNLSSRVTELISEGEQSDDAAVMKTAFSKIKELFHDFIASRSTTQREVDLVTLKELQNEKKMFDERLTTLAKEEEGFQKKYESLKTNIETVKDESRDAEREIFRIMTAQSELRAELSSGQVREEKMRHEGEDFNREITEAGVLVGRGVVAYEDFIVVGKEGSPLSREEIAAEPRDKQGERRRTIEKIKIRLEEAGGAGSDEVMKEYKEVKERDDFFERELADLDASAQSLTGLIRDLEEQLDTRFKEGIEKINTEFQKYFSLLFDGGTARMEVVKEVRRRRPSDDSEYSDEGEEEGEALEGIDVVVNLPHKRVKGLEMLSGGERALTSIAALFAMSQVNPPPFIILDETDAALDEANSRKYGDMIENLSKQSQLILITHNRETMSRAGILYGVTMGSDGVSKLLSVKLEEAVAVAK